MKIIIGKEYEKSFESIKNLQKCLPDLIDVDSDGSIIEKATGNKYALDSSLSVFNDSVIAYVDESGSSWFSELRGEPSRGDDSSQWINFIDLVASTYHKKYSLLEFKQVEKTSNSKNDESNCELIKKFLKTFNMEYLLHHPAMINSVPVATPKDIFILNLKASVDSEAGEAKTILARMYFAKQASRYRPLSISETVEIDANMKNVFNEDSEKTLTEDRNFIVSEILSEFDLLVKKESIEKYFVFSNDDDIDAFNKLLKSGPENGVTIRCKDIKINTISHITWNDFAYFVQYDGKNILKFVFDSEGVMSLYCVNCAEEEVLVYNNEIMLDEKKLKANDYNVNEKVILKSNEDIFGLEYYDMECVKSCAKLNDHIIKVDCPWTISNHNGCAKIKCHDSVFRYGEKTYCKDCVYPEIVTPIQNGLYPTNKLSYVSNTSEKLEHIGESNKDYYHRCRACGSLIRENTASVYSRFYCPTCESLISKTDANTLKYKEYSDYLPLGIRLFGVFKEKCASENDEIVSFRIGNQFYYFDKFEVISNKQVSIRKGGKL